MGAPSTVGTGGRAALSPVLTLGAVATASLPAAPASAAWGRTAEGPLSQAVRMRRLAPAASQEPYRTVTFVSPRTWAQSCSGTNKEHLRRFVQRLYEAIADA